MLTLISTVVLFDPAFLKNQSNLKKYLYLSEENQNGNDYDPHQNLD